MVDVSGGPVALVVDDDHGVSAAVGEVLATLRCRTLVASSLEEALAVFRAVRAHFSILDVHVRDRTGFEILGELRALAANHPAIFMSGDFTAEIRRRAADFAAHSLLEKPLRLGQLRDAVGGLLNSGRLTTR
ncbi:MAG TPA: response regulator [Planctomycetota bacterium]|nr:response regulator [Planctomycetota bacterium]